MSSSVAPLLAGSQAGDATVGASRWALALPAAVQAGGAYTATTGNDHHVAGNLVAQGDITITAARDIATKANSARQANCARTPGATSPPRATVLAIGDAQATSVGAQTYGDAVRGRCAHAHCRAGCHQHRH